MPNGNDQRNKKLFVYGNEDRVRRIDFIRVYDRWGELVYSVEDLDYNEPDGQTNEGWDGTFNGEPLNSGVFVYHMNVIFIGAGGEDVEKEFIGDVTLIR